MVVLTTGFIAATHVRRKILGMEGHPVVTVPHPLASLSADDASAIASRIVDAVAAGLTEPPG